MLSHHSLLAMSMLFVSLLLCVISAFIYVRTAVSLSKELDTLGLICAKNNPMGVPSDIRELKAQRGITAAAQLKWTTFKLLMVTTLILIDVVALISITHPR